MTSSIVCVVDDTEMVRETLVSLIARSLDVTVKGFGSAQEFLDEVDTRCDCLVVDLRMPGMSGFELMRELRVRQLLLPTIVISGHIIDDVDIHKMPYEVEAVLQKPFKVGEIVQHIKKCLDEPRP